VIAVVVRGEGLGRLRMVEGGLLGGIGGIVMDGGIRLPGFEG
jgi:hypothetical protein